LGLHFDHCNQFITGLSFYNCIINISSFYKLKLKKTIFNNSALTEADFTETDLTGSVFSNCDLGKTIFENTILEKADLRTSYNYSINPEVNRIKKAKFSTTGIAGLLHKYDIEIE
jgi:fluoroquinolone resistance protein